MPNFKNTYIPIDAPDYPTCTTYVFVDDVNINPCKSVPYQNQNNPSDVLYITVDQDDLQKNRLTISRTKSARPPKTTELLKADKARSYRIIGEFLAVVSKPPYRAAKRKSPRK